PLADTVRLGIDRDEPFAEIVRLEIAEFAPGAYPVVRLVREVDVQLCPPASRTLVVGDLFHQSYHESTASNGYYPVDGTKSETDECPDDSRRLVRLSLRVCKTSLCREGIRENSLFPI